MKVIITTEKIKDSSAKRKKNLNPEILCFSAQYEDVRPDIFDLFDFFYCVIEANKLDPSDGIGLKYFKNAIIFWFESGFEFVSWYRTKHVLLNDLWYNQSESYDKEIALGIIDDTFINNYFSYLKDELSTDDFIETFKA